MLYMALLLQNIIAHCFLSIFFFFVTTNLLKVYFSLYQYDLLREGDLFNVVYRRSSISYQNRQNVGSGLVLVCKSHSSLSIRSLICIVGDFSIT